MTRDYISLFVKTRKTRELVYTNTRKLNWSRKNSNTLSAYGDQLGWLGDDTDRTGCTRDESALTLASTHSVAPGDKRKIQVCGAS